MAGDDDSIQDIEKYNMIKQGLSQYIKPENQKKFRRKNIQKREQKLMAKTTTKEQNAKLAPKKDQLDCSPANPRASKI